MNINGNRLTYIYIYLTLVLWSGVFAQKMLKIFLSRLILNNEFYCYTCLKV